VDGKKEGKGVWTMGDVEYKGDFVDDWPKGNVTEILGDGVVYEGQYKRDARKGRGTETRTNGYRYTGCWERHVANGEGVLTDPKGRVIFEGQWKDGVVLVLVLFVERRE
jgi:hypothetical protein